MVELHQTETGRKTPSRYSQDNLQYLSSVLLPIFSLARKNWSLNFKNCEFLFELRKTGCKIWVFKSEDPKLRKNTFLAWILYPFAKKWTSCKILELMYYLKESRKSMHFLQDTSIQCISCKIFPGNAFLARSFQAMHFLQDPSRQYISYKIHPGNAFHARSIQAMHFLQDTFKNFQKIYYLEESYKEYISCKHPALSCKILQE